MYDEPKRAEGLGPKPPRLGSKKARSKKSLVNEHEGELAVKLGGRRMPQSGAIAGFRGDIKVQNFLLDSKETENSSIIVSHGDLTKIVREAHQSAKMPGLVLTIKKVPPTTPNEWVLISLDDFATILESLSQTRGSPKDSNSEGTENE